MAKLSSSNGIEKFPKLRFPEFKEPWKQVKLSDFTERIVRKNKNNETDLPLTISSKDGLVDQISFFNKTVASKDISNYYLLRNGEFAYNKSYSVGYDFGSIKRLERYPMGALSTLYICFTLTKHNGDYIKTYFDSLKWYKEIYIISAEGARNHGLLNVPTDEFFDTYHYITDNPDEQQKIAAFMNLIDKRIQKQQQLLENIKKYKRGSLSALFPKKREITPQYRFAGFTKPWEQRELGEIATETYGGGTPKTSNEEFWKGDIPWIQSSDLIDECLFDVSPRKCISQEAVSKSATKLVPQNSIAIVTRVGVGKLAFIPFSYATSQDFLSLSGLKIDPEFTVYALYKMMQSVSNEVQGTSIKGVTKDELLTKKIIFPSCNEQKKIGAYLHNLDSLITLHQHKYDTLLSLKNAILQQMFI